MRDEMPDMVLVQNWKIVVRCHPQYVDSTVELEGSVGNDALIHWYFQKIYYKIVPYFLHLGHVLGCLAAFGCVLVPTSHKPACWFIQVLFEQPQIPTHAKLLTFRSKLHLLDALLQQLEGKFQGILDTCFVFVETTKKSREKATRRKLSSADVAIFGGINFGDRFGSWRDFAVRLEGDADVSELLSSLGWQMPYSLGTLPAL